MSIKINITKLLDEGKITQAEYNKLSTYSSKETHSLAIGTLISFGIIAVALGTIALRPDPQFVGLLSSIAILLGMLVLYKLNRQWGIVGDVLIILGSIGLSWVMVKHFDHVNAFYGVIALNLILGILTRSSLLMVMSALAINPLIGAGSIYDHATYIIVIQKPIMTALIFGAVGVTAYIGSTQLAPYFKSLLTAYSRTAFLMVNLAFWVGSLWGDSMTDKDLSEGAMSLLWAALLIVMGLWGVKYNKRNAVNTAAIFGGIHFYTQYFEFFDANPSSLIGAGVIAIFISFSLWKYNQEYDLVRERILKLTKL